MSLYSRVPQDINTYCAHKDLTLNHKPNEYDQHFFAHLNQTIIKAGRINMACGIKEIDHKVLALRYIPRILQATYRLFS